MKAIDLTRGLAALIDDEDYERVACHRWHAIAMKNGYYAGRRLYLAGGERKTLYLHRFIIGAPAGVIVDHRNGDTLDDRRHNLRRCSQSENIINGTLAIGGGVHRCNETGRWFARISHNSRRIFLGRFPTREVAEMAVLEKRQELGQFQRTAQKPAHGTTDKSA